MLLFLLWACLVFFPFDHVDAAPRSTRAGNKESRYALVIAAVGDSSTHTEWLKGARFRGRNWDIVALYYGQNPNKFSCKECRTVYTGQGAKWNLLYRFLKETKGYRRFAHRYAAIMIADDDLKMNAKDLNKYFDLMIAFNLTLAQPSECMYVFLLIFIVFLTTTCLFFLIIPLFYLLFLISYTAEPPPV